MLHQKKFLFGLRIFSLILPLPLCFLPILFLGFRGRTVWEKGGCGGGSMKMVRRRCQMPAFIFRERIQGHPFLLPGHPYLETPPRGEH